MSKKGGVMDLYFQKYNITRVIKIRERNLDQLENIFDLLDSKLHFFENVSNIISGSYLPFF